MKQFHTKLTEALQYKQETFAVGSQFPFGDFKKLWATAVMTNHSYNGMCKSFSY